MLAVKVPSIVPLWYSRKTPERKRHQAYLSSNKRNGRRGMVTNVCQEQE
jgi:hypothetical protein